MPRKSFIIPYGLFLLSAFIFTMSVTASVAEQGTINQTSSDESFPNHPLKGELNDEQWEAQFGAPGVQGGAVTALDVDSDGNLYIGGTFNQAGGRDANHVAMWDGISWHSLADGVNDTVTALVVDNNGDLYVAGEFTQAGTQPANHLARWDGSSWSPLGSGVNDIVLDLVVTDENTLIAGGKFTMAGGQTANYIAS